MISLINHDCSVLLRGQLFFSYERSPGVSVKEMERTYIFRKIPNRHPMKNSSEWILYIIYSERPAQILHNVYIYTYIYSYNYIYIIIVIQYNGWMIWIRHDKISHQISQKFYTFSHPFPITAVTFSRGTRLRFWCRPRDFPSGPKGGNHAMVKHRTSVTWWWNPESWLLNWCLLVPDDHLFFGGNPP
jgi:hypothetical protein